MISSLTGGGSLPGLSATVGYKLVQSTLDKQIAAFEKTGAAKVEIDYFRKNIGKVESADDLVKDYRLFRFTLSAFGLDSQINSQGLMKKALSENWVDQKSIVNRLADPRFREMAKAIDFFFSKDSKLKLPEFIDQLVDRYVTAEFEKTTENTNPAVRLALYFKRKAPDATNWFQIMGDKPLYEVVRTALQIQPAGARADLNRYAERLEQRVPLEKLRDPKFLDRFISRFLANYDAKNVGSATASAVSLVQPFTRTSSAVSLGASTILSLATQR